MINRFATMELFAHFIFLREYISFLIKTSPILQVLYVSRTYWMFFVRWI